MNKNVIQNKSNGPAYTIETTRFSYFALDSNGKPELKNSLPYRAEGMYRFDRTIDPDKTAVVIMDPWVDMASEHLNEYYGKVTESRIIPLVMRALTRGHPIIVLTNDPNEVKYNTKIHHKLETLVENNKIRKLFHQKLDDAGFAT